jgi:hypothetical protein
VSQCTPTTTIVKNELKNNLNAENKKKCKILSQKFT